MTNNRSIIHVPRRFVADEWGGTETVILEVSRQQRQSGWEPEIFTSIALSNSRVDEFSGIPVRRFPYCYPFFGLSSADKLAMDKKGGNLLSFSLFGALLKKSGVRIFHAHTLKRLGGEVLTAARLRRKPFVATLHGGVFDVPAAERGRAEQPGKGKLEWGKPFGALFGSRRLLENADHLICVGQGEFMKARQHLSHERISFLPNGVDVEKFSGGDGTGFRAKHGIRQDAFLVLCLSRIDAQKNQRALLEAFARLRRTRSDLFLLLIGPQTQPAYAEELQTFIRENGLGDCAKILPGFRNDDPDLPAAYQACDVFVLPSLHEPFGIVVLEAWSCKKPVIAARVGGLASLVLDAKTGLSFDPEHGGGAELSARIETLAADAGLRTRLGEAGYAEVSGKYTWKSVSTQLESIYAAAEEHAARG